MHDEKGRTWVIPRQSAIDMGHLIALMADLQEENRRLRGQRDRQAPEPPRPAPAGNLVHLAERRRR